MDVTELLTIHFTDLLNPEFYIHHGGVWLLLFIVFAETGLFIGFFLPGDSLLFVAGIFSNDLSAEIIDLHKDIPNLLLLVVLFSIAGILGNYAGYWFGKKSGPALFHRKDGFFFRKKYLFRAKDFYDKNGAATIVVARFIPIIRTFSSIIAGIVGMPVKPFSLYNILGSIAWVSTMLFGGHYLYAFFLHQYNFDLKSHIDLIVIGIVLLSVLPVILKLIKKPKTDIQHII